MTDLDALVQRARDATVRRDVAEAYVRELDRWAARPPERRAWLAWTGWGLAGLAVAAAVLLFVRARGGAGDATGAPIQIGDRVAIVAEPGTAYRVVQASDDRTTIDVDHGAITARLWPGAAPHQLTLEGGGVTARAKGTVYQLAVSDGHASVFVEQGTVEVTDRGELHRVTAGTAWPATAAAADHRGARALLAVEALAPAPGVAPPADADASPIAPPAATDASPAPIDAPPIAHAPHVPPTPMPPAPPADADAAPDRTIKDRWRDARLLRGQGRFADAVHECLAIADAHDPTWSPIALVEALRIDAGPLADPEHAIELADRMLREWPHDALISETRALRCQALAQLGRGAECAPPPTPAPAP